MYPIYPLLAVMAAFSLDTLRQLCTVCLQAILSYSSSSPNNVTVGLVTFIAYSVVFGVSLVGGASRVAASHRNFGGIPLC
jgi:hypothetical protein